MKIFWQRFLNALTPGVRIMLGLLAAACLAAVIGNLTHAFELYDWLGLSGPKFWGGQIWRLVTYVLLPAGILDLILNSIALVILGGLLERHWRRGGLWSYCLVVAAGAGVAKVLLPFSSLPTLVGAAPMIFGLLIGWGVWCGHENINIFPFGELTVWKLVLIAGTVSLLTMFFTAGPVTAIIMASAGLTGWLYLRLKQKWLMSRVSRVAHSERMSRLEL